VTLTVVHAAGSPRALGRAHGEAFAEGIHAACDFYRSLAARLGGDLGELGRAALPYVDAGRRRVPEIVEELDGMIEGAGVSPEEGYALNCLEEVWGLDACTTLVHGRFLAHAEQWYAGHPSVGVVCALPDAGPAFVSPTCIGFLPAVGMNASGFAQGIDSLRSSDDRVGIPRVLVSRLALGAPGLSAAVAAACIEGRAGGYAHVLASLERTLVVETSATNEEVIERATAHTNHYFSDSLSDRRSPGSAGSRARLARAEELLSGGPPESLEDCARILSDHGADERGSTDTICVHDVGIGAEGTVFGMVCDLASGTMIVSDGAPCRGVWEEFALPASAEAPRVV
jgi:isopenicillin-N N-acyltransferase-like protein